MINMTTRIAVKITKLPPFEFSWDDVTPQKPPSSLSIDDLLPSAEDGRQLYHRACEYVRQFMIRCLPALKRFKEPEASGQSACMRSNIVPMPMLQRDEK